MASNIEGEVADFVVAEYTANPQFIENLIAKGEGALQTFLVGVFSQVKVGGLAGIILPALEGGVEKFVAQLIAKYDPPALYALIGQLLQKEAKQLGG